MRNNLPEHLDFLCVDMISVELSLALAWMVLGFYNPGVQVHVLNLGILLPVFHWLVVLILDSYQGILQRGYLKELYSLIQLKLGTFFLMMFFFYFLNPVPSLPQRLLLLYYGLNIPITYCLRFAQKFRLRRRYSDMKYSRQILVITTERLAHEMIGKITGSVIRNYQFFGLAVIDRPMVGEQIRHIMVSADRDGLIEYAKEHVVDEALINFPDEPDYQMTLIHQLLEMGITVHIYMEEAYHNLPNRSISNVFGYNVLTTTISPISARQAIVKRLMDLAGGLVGCLITLILTVFIGPLIYFKSPGPVFFVQQRVGKRGRIFPMYKFRSMYMDAEERKKELMEKNKIAGGMMFKIEDDPRVIKGIGQFIRKTSLDEFPQFFNVLRGEMSIVGTRPPTVDEYMRYSPRHKRRLAMAPGITGLWQVSGRSNITDFEEVVRLDTEYIENWSLNGDIKIILKTIRKVLRSDDAF